MLLIDSHCHLHLLDLAPDGNDVHKVIARALAHDVGGLLNVSVNIRHFLPMLQMIEPYPFIWTSVGLHPNDQEEEVNLKTLIEFGKRPKVIAVGETGLDYFRSSSDVEWQRTRFRTHIAAAQQLQKPLIVHMRAAQQDTIRIMQEEGAAKVGGVMHCFTEDWMVAKQALDLGFYISFSGIVTFKNAAIIQEVASKMPLNRMLIETDSPYLAPNPQRGKPNEPGYLRHTAEYLALLRQIPLEQLAEQTTANFFTLFKGAERPHV